MIIILLTLAIKLYFFGQIELKCVTRAAEKVCTKVKQNKKNKGQNQHSAFFFLISQLSLIHGYFKINRYIQQVKGEL